MKGNVKQGIKRIIAFSMALLIALLPINGNIPDAFGTDTGGVFKVEFDEYVDKDSISLIDSGDPDHPILPAFEGNSNIATWNLSASGSYSIKASVESRYTGKFTVMNPADNSKIDSSGATISIAAEELSNGEATDREYQTVTNGEQTYTVSIVDAENISVTGTGITYAADTGEVKIASDTPADTKVQVNFSLPMNKKADISRSEITYQGVAEGKRSFTYSTTVAGLLTDGILPGISDAYFSITTDGNTTVSVSGGWGDAAGTQCYEPLKSNEVFNITVTPAAGYELTAFTVGGTSYFERLVKGAGSYTISSRELNPLGTIQVSSALAPPTTPVVKFGPIEEWYKDSAEITVTIPAGDMPSGCKLQYAFALAGQNPAAWTDVSGFVNDGNSHKVTVSYGASGNGNLYLRYARTADGVGSASVSSGLIHFDSTAPSDVKAEIYVNGVKNNSLEWVNAVDTVNIRVSATELESGLNRLEYAFDGVAQTPILKVTESENGGYFEIPYTIDNRCTTITYSVVDKMENTSGSMNLDVSGIKFDLVLPGAEIVYKDVSGNVLLDPSKWQTGKVTMEITPWDGEAPAGEEQSGFSSLLVKDGETTISGREDSGTYVFEFEEDGSHSITIEVRDAAGNFRIYSPIINIDQAGPSEQGVVFNDSSSQSSFGNDFVIKAQANSVSGIKEMIFTFYDLEKKPCGTPVMVTGISHNIGSCLYSQSGLENFQGYVQVTYVDNASRGLPVKGDFHEIRYNSNGARIYAEAQESWTRDSVPVTATIEDSITEIQKIEFFVDGALFETIIPTNPHKMTCGIALSDTSLSALGTQVTIVATSSAGVQSVSNKVVCIDKQAPVVSLGGVSEGAIYNANQTLQITTTENIWQAMRPVSVTATRTIDGNTTSMDLGAYGATDVTSTVGRTFTEDGIYQVTVRAVDAAGNTDTKSISFTIDKTAPVLSMTGIGEGAYSSRPVSIQFHSVESFYETNNVRINVERKLGGSTYGRTVGFTNTGRISELNYTFSEDGDYTITMTAADGAGNIAATQTLTFTVDCTAPVVNLSGTRDYFVTNRSVSINFSVVESYYETNEVQIQGTRRLANGRTEPIRISEWSNSGITSSLNQEFTENGYYTITMTATDKAGNNKRQTIHFTIDTEPPVIGDLSQYDGKYLSEFQLKESLEDLISELTVPTVKMTLNGEAYDGSEITQDGKYTLVIEVSDEVGLSASKSIEFVIDRTAPKIIFAGAENKRTYTETVNLNLSLENENDTIVAILINGDPYELTAGAASYDLVFDTFGEYEVVVNTIDEAGNENSQTIIFTYAEHRNVVFLWILIGAAVIAAGLIVYLLVKSKKAA